MYCTFIVNHFLLSKHTFYGTECIFKDSIERLLNVRIILVLWSLDE